MSEFDLKDSGERRQFASGMVRDTTEGKVNFLLIRVGPMFARWAAHLTKGAVKYPPVAPGVSNWTLADGPEELERFRESFCRHAEQWLRGDRDEDHAAAMFFNINGAEYLLEKGVSLESPSEDPTVPVAARPSSKSDIGEFAPSTTEPGSMVEVSVCRVICKDHKIRHRVMHRSKTCCLIGANLHEAV